MKSVKKMLLGIALILFAGYCVPFGIAGNGTAWVYLTLLSIPIAISGIGLTISGYLQKDDSEKDE